MKPQHHKPCGSCPFLKSKANFFHPARAKEIVKELVDADGHFQCHKTVDYSRDDNAGNGRTTRDTRLCAGALIVTEKSGECPGQFPRICARLGCLDWGKIERQARTNTTVYDNFDAFLEAQKR